MDETLPVPWAVIIDDTVYLRIQFLFDQFKLLYIIPHLNTLDMPISADRYHQNGILFISEEFTSVQSPNLLGEDARR